MGVPVAGGSARLRHQRRRCRRGREGGRTIAQHADFERARRARRSCRARGPTRVSGIASSAASGPAAKSRAGATARRASTPASVSPSVRPAEASIAMPQRVSSAATRRAIGDIGRDQRGGAPPGVSSASRIAAASASASWFSSSATMIATSASADDGVSASCAARPQIGRIGGAQRLGEEASAGAGGGRCGRAV